MCDWNNLDKELQVIKKKINDNEKVIAPFVGTTLFDSPELQLKISEIWAYRNKSENSKYNFSKNTNNKIKLGYFSAEFRSHAMGYLMNRIYDLHDKSLFEVYGFYFGPPINSKDKLQKKIINSFDKFIDVNHLSDHEITNLVRDLEIDIGIDLMPQKMP